MDKQVSVVELSTLTEVHGHYLCVRACSFAYKFSKNLMEIISQWSVSLTLLVERYS